MHKCEICNRKDATTICIKCRRLICEDCLSPEYLICKECYEFKKAVEENRELVLDYARKMTKICLTHLSSDTCSNCIILRELVISLLKMVRELRQEAEREFFESLIERSAALERRLKMMLISILMKQGLAIPEPKNDDSW